MTLSRREARKAQTRKALKDAARNCFLNEGLADTSVGSIVRAAGVAQGTFYVHFENKEALLDELLADFNELFVERLVATLAAGDPEDLEGLVAASAGVFLDTWEEHRDFVAAYAQRLASGLDPMQLRDGINPQVALLLLSRLGSVGTELDVPLVTHALLAMWARMGMQFLFNDTVTRERALATLVPLTLGAIGVRK